VNLEGGFACGQTAALARGEGGRIANIASMAGTQGRVPYLD
jgi:NAD(P)-dependent dehydrogenase (short-subunit alcohol dehydrogenase family)